MKRIRFGLGIATGTEGLMYPIPYSSAREVVEISVLAERLGFDSVWGNDHIQTQEYVYQKFGDYPRYYAPLVELAAIAEHTTNLLLCTALLVLPFRHPVNVAKEVATLDHLSGGRVRLGVGIGAYREEFEAQYGRDAAGINRGEMLEESVQLLHRIFTEENVTHEGKYYSVRNLKCFPKPLQNPFPLYFGGNSTMSYGRVAKYGTGWLPAGLKVEEIRQAVEQIGYECEKQGRSLDEIDIAPQFGICIKKTHEEAHAAYQNSQHYRHSLSLQNTTYKGKDIANYAERRIIGSPQEVAQRIQNYIDAGVTHFAALVFAGNSLEDTKEQMHLFAEEVMPFFQKK
ncbi:MAG TPA: LLM class flavin-dependent oxidoreductase [Clostridiales bacterium]|nr:LLM class flavin-dependent oxidoreductase [Clostridiales bacterium]